MSAVQIKAKNSLEEILSPEQIKNYYGLLLQRFATFKPISITEFCNKLHKILTTPEQFYRHNILMQALTNNSLPDFDTSASNNGEPNQSGDSIEDSAANPPFHIPFTSSSSSTKTCLSNSTKASNLFKSMVAVSVWRNGLNGMDEDAIHILKESSKAFINEIIRGMLSRKRSYKIRNGHFQYSFGSYSPYSSVINDANTEDKVEGSDDNGGSVSMSDISKPSVELNLELLFQTLRDDPSIIPFKSLRNLHMLKIAMQLND